MLLREFPDINWIRKQSQSNFSDGKALNNLSLKRKGWPDVVLNTKCAGVERSGIVSPFSVFMNKSGSSTVRNKKKEIILTENNFCIVNPKEEYGLLIQESQETEIFNLHISEHLLNDVWDNMNLSNADLLDLKTSSYSPELQFKSHWKNQNVRQAIEPLIHYYSSPNIGLTLDEEYEHLSTFIGHLITELVDQSNPDRIGLNDLKTSTKDELVTRLNQSVDFIHANLYKSISIDEMANVACLSKFHFLRTFKSYFDYTPMAYIAQLKLEVAERLLKENKLDLAEIGMTIGFSELSAFSRFMKKQKGYSPSQLRGRISNLGQAVV